MPKPRYGLYFTPAERTDLTARAASWLGYDAWQQHRVPQADGFAECHLERITQAPRVYGFHATLKAPFYLADGKSERSLLDAVSRFSEQTKGTRIAHLDLRWIGPFLALVPRKQDEPLPCLAGQITETFEPFRAPLSPQDMKRRLQSPLTPRQVRALLTQGYPYLGDDFHFHMTLTGPVETGLRPAVEEAASRHFADHLGRELAVDRLAIFKQPEAGTPFSVLTSFHLQS